MSIPKVPKTIEINFISRNYEIHKNFKKIVYNILFIICVCNYSNRA